MSLEAVVSDGGQLTDNQPVGCQLAGSQQLRDAQAGAVSLRESAQLSDEDRYDFMRIASFYVNKMGWPIYPLRGFKPGTFLCTCGRPDCDKPGKHPASRHGKKDASLDLELLSMLTYNHPGAGWATVTGAESRIIVVDIDGADGENSVAELANQYHDLPPTVEVRSGSGGRHLYYSYRSGVRTSSSKLAKNIDIRADNGSIILPPTLHRSGQRYEWVRPPWKYPIKPLPTWISARLEYVTAQQGEERRLKYAARMNEMMGDGPSSSAGRSSGGGSRAGASSRHVAAGAAALDARDDVSAYDPRTGEIGTGSPAERRIAADPRYISSYQDIDHTADLHSALEAETEAEAGADAQAGTAPEPAPADDDPWAVPGVQVAPSQTTPQSAPPKLSISQRAMAGIQRPANATAPDPRLSPSDEPDDERWNAPPIGYGTPASRAPRLSSAERLAAWRADPDRALDRITMFANEVAGLSQGSRNDTMNRNAYIAFKIARDAGLLERVVIERFVEAGKTCGLTMPEILGTLKSAQMGSRAP